MLGVLTFISRSPQDGSIVQGFNFLIPARDVRTFVEDTDIVPGRDSGFNAAWTAGLSALFAERYSQAVTKLTEANKILPNLADVKRALTEAEFKVKNPAASPVPLDLGGHRRDLRERRAFRRPCSASDGGRTATAFCPPRLSASSRAGKAPVLDRRAHQERL